MVIDANYAEKITDKIIDLYYPHIKGKHPFPRIILAPSHRNPITGKKIPRPVMGQLGINLSNLDPKIIIYPYKKRNSPILAKVLAHEIGHYIDFLQYPNILKEQHKLAQRQRLLSRFRNALIIFGGSLLAFPESRELGLRTMFLSPIITRVSVEALYNFAPHEKRAEEFARRFYYNYIPVFQ